ncbi:MAG: hypothetical protein AAB697_00585 [Patescibacteria group bacterium]
MAVIPTVVEVRRQGLKVCGTNVVGVAQMPFLEGVVKDLDVADQVKLATQVKEFVTASQIKPTPLVIILSSEVYFDREMTGTSDSEISAQGQSFVDSVPLVNPSSKLFKLKDKYRMVVINRRLYESIRSAFEAVGFPVTAVVPELVLGEAGVAGDFDANACRVILKKMDYVLENSFIGGAQPVEKKAGINLGLDKLFGKHL